MSPPSERDRAATERCLNEVIRFIHSLRRKGADVPLNSGLNAARALSVVGFTDRERSRAALQSTLISNREDTPIFEELFPGFWKRLIRALFERPHDELAEERARQRANGGGPENPLRPDRPTNTRNGDRRDPGSDDSFERVVQSSLAPLEESEASRQAEEDQEPAATYSASGEGEGMGVEPSTRRPRQDELRRFERALAGLPGRRFIAHQSGEFMDARRALRLSFQTGGTVIVPPRQTYQETIARCCVLVDVSKSVLDTIDRGFLLQFLYRLNESSRTTRIFFFDTDLQDVTELFQNPSFDTSFEQLTEEVSSWGGGTRIGEALAQVRRKHPDAVDHLTNTLVVSDGLDVGAMELLERHMVWLYRRSRSVLWLNPLASSPEYRPTCSGMSTALPYTDGLFAFSGPGDLDEIARQIEQQGLHGTIGYQHDPRRARASRVEAASSTDR